MTEQTFPEGDAFLDLISGTENRCAEATRGQPAVLGEKAPECHERLGDVLSLLYRDACCFGGCPGGDHFGQRFAGRIVSHALGSYKLMSLGYYDESLALTRNLGELANLLWLFVHRPAERERWVASDKKDRIQHYSPVKVRLALEAQGCPVPIDESRYAGLCEVAVHPTPNTAPQAHNLQGIPTLGSVFQEGGFLISLNELAGATGVCAAAVTPMLKPGERNKRLKEMAVSLLLTVGGVDLETLRGKIAGV